MAGSELTPRQRRIARLVAAGSTNGEIAAELDLPLETVKGELSTAIARAGVHRREELAEWHRGSSGTGAWLGRAARPGLVVAGVAGLAVAIVLLGLWATRGQGEPDRAEGLAEATSSTVVTTATVPATVPAAPARTSTVGPTRLLVEPPIERYLVRADGGVVGLQASCDDGAQVGALDGGTAVQLVAVGIGDCRGWSMVQAAEGGPLWVLDGHLASRLTPAETGVPSLTGTAWTVYVGWADDPRVWLAVEVVFLGGGELNWGTTDAAGTGHWAQQDAAIRFVINGFSTWDGAITNAGRRIEATDIGAAGASVRAPTWFAER